MAKNKFDFIGELLVEKKINQNQRERILALASKEISLEGSLEERVKKIEEIIFQSNKDSDIEISQTKLNKQKTIHLKKYFDPYYLYKFLFEYNQNPVLRSTCHDANSDTIDTINEYCNSENYCFSKHLCKIIDNYIEHEKEYYAPPKVKALIRGYLTGKDYEGNELRGWSLENVHINWSSNLLSKWASKHSNFPPNFSQELAGKEEIELFQINPQIISPISYEPIQNFTQLVLHFKNLFHIKSGNQSLKAILGRVNNLKKWHEKVDFEILEGHFSIIFEHFTDIDRLIQAYNKLIQIIIEQHNGDDKPRVILSYYEENLKVYLSIHHSNGKYNKSIESILTRPIGDRYEDLINKQINGLCNLYLKANFDNGKFAEFNLWDGKKHEIKYLPIFEGVEHLLEFPKFKVK